MRSAYGLRATLRTFLLLLPLLLGTGWGANCQQTSVGLFPLTDLGPDLYRGYPGGLYPDGLNERPPAHERAGLNLTAQVQPLDVDGHSDPIGGKIVLVSIGMSNATQEFAPFKQLADRDPDRNPQLVIVDGAQGGQTASIIMNPNAPFWQVVDQRLAQAGVTPNQVQAAWVKEADAQPREGWPAYPLKLQTELTAIMQILKARFPNILLAYQSSRTYGGYASTPLNPEPYAYASGFAFKWLIESQIQGDPSLNYDPDQGEVRSPWLAWGPYLWADGLVPRGDGLIWLCQDFRAGDGTHPSLSGQRKVANMLLDFFKNDSTTSPWFLRPQTVAGR